VEIVDCYLVACLEKDTQNKLGVKLGVTY
jgi:hypothetical protein